MLFEKHALTSQFEAAAPIEMSLCDRELFLVTCCPLIISNFRKVDNHYTSFTMLCSQTFLVLLVIKTKVSAYSILKMFPRKHWRQTVRYRHVQTDRVTAPSSQVPICI